jgi:glycosyltransferase involved in cell wall biosynthesis
MMEVLFVAPVSGYVSYNVVAKGLLRALTKAGIRPLVADTSWDGSPSHTDGYFDATDIRWLERRDVSNLLQKGVTWEGAPKLCIAINPTHHLMDITDSGIKVAGLHVGDVDEIPPAWRDVIEREAVVLAPSSWVAGVIEDSGVTTRTMVLNHGVGPMFRPSLEASSLDELPCVLLHACASVFYPERKSTPQVLEAFKILVDRGHDIVLRLVFGLRTKQVKRMLRSVPQEIRPRLQVFFHEGSRPQDEMAEVYRNAHVLLAPSRAEGFGIMPVESRACGVPVIQTLCTGHFDHLELGADPVEWGICPVSHGDLVSAWGDYGRAPEVRTEWIVNATEAFLHNRRLFTSNAREHAAAVRENWSWERVSQPLIDWVRSELS